DCDRNICHHAIAHRDAFYFAHPVTFPGAAKQTADTGVGFFHRQTERIYAIAIDERNGRSGIDHQRAASIIYGNRNQQMIAITSLQLCAGKSLAGKRGSECAAGWLSSCTEWRHHCEEKYWDQFVHTMVLGHGYRFVEAHTNVLRYANRSTKAKSC